MTVYATFCKLCCSERRLHCHTSTSISSTGSGLYRGMYLYCLFLLSWSLHENQSERYATRKGVWDKQAAFVCCSVPVGSRGTEPNKPVLPSLPYSPSQTTHFPWLNGKRENAWAAHDRKVSYHCEVAIEGFGWRLPNSLLWLAVVFPSKGKVSLEKKYSSEPWNKAEPHPHKFLPIHDS
jgi:hypothetical protein